jgi:hypothetical protein
MDDNQDGVISQGEWRGNRRSFEVHDWNNDGVLSGAELDPGSARVGRRLERFEALDANNDGRIARWEWDRSRMAFNRLDANNDDVLSRVELDVLGSEGDQPVGTSGSSILVDSRERWTDTGIDVRPGEVIDFDVNGGIQLSTDSSDIADPDGARSGRRASQAPLRTARAGALIARIDNEAPFLVGNQRSVRAVAGGRLYLGVNDDDLTDNSGHFQVVVSVG